MNQAAKLVLLALCLLTAAPVLVPEASAADGEGSFFCKHFQIVITDNVQESHIECRWTPTT
jgi:hypothetical protein